MPALQAAKISSVRCVHLPRGLVAVLPCPVLQWPGKWMCSGAPLLLQVSLAWWLQC